MDINKNREVVHSISVDISTDKLEETFNKSIDEGYQSSPTNDKFVVTQQKSRGNAQFPLILISGILETESFKVKLTEALQQVPQIGDTIKIMYKRGGKGVSLCSTYANKQTVAILKSFCIPFDYYIKKGVKKKDLEFDELIDLDVVGANILIKDDNVDQYSPNLKDDVVASIDCSK